MPTMLASELPTNHCIRSPLGSYTIVGKHGEGGFGITYLARTDTGQQVIIKELRIERLSDWKALELFEREADILKALNHPKIPKYIDFFAYDGQSVLPPSALKTPGAPDCTLMTVQTYIKGPSLQDCISRGQRFSPQTLERFLRDMLSILSYLHEHSPPIVHRDIQPKNIIMGSSNEPYLIDFGAVQNRQYFGTPGSTTVGTAGYMPMEQAMGTPRPASDLFALGITVLYAATHIPPNEMPVDDNTGKIRIEKILSGIPENLKTALSFMVEPIVGQRAQSAKAVIDLLHGHAPIKGQLQTVAQRSQTNTALQPTRYALFALLALASLATFGVGTLLFLVKTPHPNIAPVTVSEPHQEPTQLPSVKTGSTVSGDLVTETFSFLGTVVTSEGKSLAPNNTCRTTIEAGFRDGSLTNCAAQTQCGQIKLYDSRDPLEGTSMHSCDIDEIEVNEGQYRYLLRYQDQGARASSRAQMVANSDAGELIAHSDSPPTYKTKIKLETWSELRTGKALLPNRQQQFRAHEYKAKVQSVQGKAPVKNASLCTVLIRPDWVTAQQNCRAHVQCGQTVIYGGGQGGYGLCTVSEGSMTGLSDNNPTSADGDPRFSYRQDKSISISDTADSGEWSIELIAEK